MKIRTCKFEETIVISVHKNMDSTARQQIAEGSDIGHVNPISVRNVDGETSKPKLTPQVGTTSVNPARKDPIIVRKAAPTKETVHLDMTLPFIRNKLVDNSLGESSLHGASAYKLYHDLNKMDTLMCQNHHFLQNNMYYHPLVSRIYYGILFYIQILRCMNHAKVLDRFRKEFLTSFLETYPPESLSIAGPLAVVFQSITTSRCRFINMGKICPTIIDPTSMLTVNKKSKTPITPNASTWLYPNLYFLFGSLSTLISDRVKNLVGTPQFPRTWNPFAAFPNAAGQPNSGIPFNGLDLPTDITTWPDAARWMLACPGMNYPLESTKELDEKFSTYGSRLNIPSFTTTDGTFDIEDYCNLTSYEWFGEVMALMTNHAKYFKLSTTLDKCSVEGPATSQIICDYQNTTPVLTPPTYPGDHLSMFPLYFIAKSSNPKITDVDQMMAFASQVNIRFPVNHPFATIVSFNDTTVAGETMRTGQHWLTRPILMESKIDKGILQVKDIIQDHFYLDRPKN